MILTRRNLLRGLVAAPAIIAIDRLMPVKAWALPILYGDGIHDDTDALQAFMDGRPFVTAPHHGMVVRDGYLGYGHFKVSRTLRAHEDGPSTLITNCLFNRTERFEGDALLHYDSKTTWLNNYSP
jgi:hypothetical protein